MGKASRKPARSEVHGFAAVAAEFARLFKSLLDPYRPELHYMRGPGPKWHAKHAQAVAPEAPSVPGLARIQG